jgi:hypothetical protein
MSDEACAECGRPHPKEATRNLNFRLPVSEYEVWRKAAEEAGQSLSEWARSCVRRALLRCAGCSPMCTAMPVPGCTAWPTQSNEETPMSDPLVLEGELRVFTDWHQFALLAEEDIPTAVAEWLGEDNHVPAGRYRMTLEKIDDGDTDA